MSKVSSGHIQGMIHLTKAEDIRTLNGMRTWSANVPGATYATVRLSSCLCCSINFLETPGAEDRKDLFLTLTPDCCGTARALPHKAQRNGMKSDSVLLSSSYLSF